MFLNLEIVLKLLLAYSEIDCTCSQGRWKGGGRRGSRTRCPLPGGAREAKVPFQFKGLPWRNSELSEMLVQLFYEFALENARNAVIELQE